MTRNEKSKSKKFIIISVVVLILVFGSTYFLFKNELKIIGTIEKLNIKKPVYYMEIDSDYYFEDFLKGGGASSDKEVSVFLSNKISKGFYSVDIENTGLACSTISAKAPDGTHVWGRNFDWKGSVPIIVKCTPKNGYSSISTADFQNITSSSDELPEGIVNQMLSISALYVPMDGINEAGLCVADLQVNEGGMVTVDTSKPDLTITTAIRLLLNKAATVEEAVELLQQYDIYASGGISHHIAISDATGNSVAIEFVDGKSVVVNTKFVTNFNLAKGDSAAGGENSKQRYEALSSICEENNGILTAEQVKNALMQVSQSDGEQTTQWSIVYDRSSLTAEYYFYGDYENPYSYSFGE